MGEILVCPVTQDFLRVLTASETQAEQSMKAGYASIASMRLPGKITRDSSWTIETSDTLCRHVSNKLPGLRVSLIINISLGRPCKVASARDLFLSNGLALPIVGLGTYQARGQSVRNAVLTALQAGYRHIGLSSTAHINFDKDSGVKAKCLCAWQIRP